VLVIGGGIVGVATARELALTCRTSVVLLEAEAELAQHQTGNNSGVVHSGLYYRPGTRKARFCVEGRRALEQYCRRRGVSYERCGKVVVATQRHQIGQLDELERRGRANGISGLQRLTPSQIREHEPHCRGVEGLYVPSTGIVDFGALTRAFAEDVVAAGHEVRTSSRVLVIDQSHDGLVIQTARDTVRCRWLVNCAGLQSDRIARLAGHRPRVRIIPFRGEYYKLVAHRQHLVRNLVYPVPDPRFPFLGVHFTRMISGGVEAGPNAVLALSRTGYRRCSFSLKDTLATLTWPGFYRLVGAHVRMGAAEQWRSLSTRAFVACLQGLIPEIRCEDVQRAGAGIRAQAVDRAGTLCDDFVLEEHDNVIHVLNAPSPAATASLAIAEAIAGRARQRFGLPMQRSTANKVAVTRQEMAEARE